MADSVFDKFEQPAKQQSVFDKFESKSSGSVFDKFEKTPTVLEQKDQNIQDKSILDSALSGVRLVNKMNMQGLGKALEFYSKSHSAVKAGLGNLVNNALGTEELRPIEAAKEGFKSGNVGADVVVKPIVTELENMMGNIHVPEGYNELIRSTTPAAAALTPNIPDVLKPEQFLKPLSQAGEVAVDMVTDPVLTALGLPYKGVGKLAKLTGLTNVLKSTLKATVKKMPKQLVDQMSWAFSTKGGRPEELVNLLDKFHTAEQKAVSNSADMMKALSEGLSQQQRQLLGQRIRGEVADLVPELEQKAEQARTTLDSLGRAYAKEGFIKEETFFKNVGKYFPRMYTNKEYQALASKHRVDTSQITKIYGQRAKRRKDLSSEQREQLGEILEPAYPIGKAMQQISHDLNVNQLFKGISKQPDFVKDVTEKGFSKVGAGPKSRSWGPLEGKYVKDDVIRDLKDVYHIPGKLERVYLKALAGYKMMKILPNPATHARNIFGSTMMYDLSPSSVSGIKGVTTALKDMSDKGKYFKEVQDVRGWSNTFFKAELEKQLDLLHGGSTIDLLMAPTTNIFDKVKKFGAKKGAEALQTLGDVYSAEDNVFKLAHYIHARTKMGKSVDEAIQYMDKWGFNYNDISPVTKFMKNYTTPFITYQAKALPRIAEVIAKNPTKFYKWPVMMDGIERMSMRVHNMDETDLAELKKNSMGKSILLPYKDSAGNPLLFDVTYLLPWGDMQEASGMFGLPSSMTISNPLFTIPAQLGTNRNIFLNQPIFTDLDTEGKPRLSTENVGKGFDFMYKALLPSVVPGGYSYQKVEKALSAAPKNVNSQGMPYDPERVFLDVIFGLKTRGVDVDRQKMFSNLRLKKWITERQSRIRKFFFKKDKTKEEKQKFLEKEKMVIMDTIEREMGK